LAAPLLITSRPRSTSSRLCPRRRFLRPAPDEPGDADLVEHLRELAAAGPPISVTRGRSGEQRRSGAERRCVAATMMVSLPFSAPAWPPDTGASRKPIPFFAAAA
jgi:hypothetical protein